MAKRVTPEDIENINKYYKLSGSVKQTAAECGWSEATVRKYLIKDYELSSVTEDDEFELDIPGIDETIEALISNEALTELTLAEEKALRDLRKKMLI